MVDLFRRSSHVIRCLVIPWHVVEKSKYLSQVSVGQKLKVGQETGRLHNVPIPIRVKGLPEEHIIPLIPAIS